KWFSGGRLWDSPADAQQARRRKPAVEKRSAAWRPGGAHADPRDRFRKKDEPRDRFRSTERESGMRGASGRPPHRPMGRPPPPPTGRPPQRSTGRPPLPPTGPPP